MKKLKLTINDEVKTFDLSENGECKVEVVNKYVPKVGDCVMKIGDNLLPTTFFKIVFIDDDGDIRFEHCIDLYKGKYTIDLDKFLFLYETEFTQITPEELKAKYAEAGYDWNYESNKVKPIKWMPKDGDECWVLDSFLQPRSFFYNSRSKYSWIFKQIEKGLVSPTEAECQKFADHCMSYINNKKE